MLKKELKQRAGLYQMSPDSLPAYSRFWLKDFLMWLSLLNVLITFGRYLFNERRLCLGNIRTFTIHCILLPRTRVWRVTELDLGFSL